MNRRPRLRPALRRTPMAAGVLVLAAALGACGGDDGTDGGGGAGADGGSSALSEDEASTALLTVDDLPDGFVEAEDDDDDDSQVGCLGATKDLSDFEATTKTESNFEMEGETGAVGILSGVNSYDDADTISEAIATFRDALSDCTTVDETDEDDFTIKLDVSLDDETTSDLADEQATVLAEGSISGGGSSFPYVAQFSVSRIDNSIAVFAVFELGDSSGIIDDFDTLNETMVGRLDDAIQG